MEHNEPQKKSFKERVFADIAMKDVKVYSKAHFVARMTLLVVVAALALVVSVFLVNYVFFSLRISGRSSLLNFGARGIYPLLIFFPWTVLLIDIALLILVEWLLKKFRFGYRSPTIYLLLALVAATMSAGYFIDRGTGFNEVLLRQADEHHLGPFDDFYTNARRAPPPGSGFCKCTITAINGNVITALDIDVNSSTTLTILLPPDYTDVSSLKVGELIFVAGAVSATDTIQAFGIRPIPAAQ